ncbi:unnamed protein product [Notodromas monacha]|uniref:Protein unc-79 homolog n=1 Tax=Notodromas monacha TaxID=399045 RepID=A0A7R9BMC6_9CRUS|nr:unnamed protein product [Notodromas monacha]CAG0916657.1 unnamed protein product [Notodromas monacha]
MHQILVETFHSESWHDRFTGVEKVMVLGQYLESRSVKTSGSPVFSSLATAFCFAVACLEDVNHHVAYRAAMCLDLLTDTGLKLLCRCLELQFDTVVVDRPIILQSLRKVSNCLRNRPVLSWEFFLARFDALFLEAQVQMDKTSSSLPFPRDLRNNNLDSKVLQRKLSRAHEAVSSIDQGSSNTLGKLTLSSTLGLKWPYKRTMSAPASIGGDTVSSGQAFNPDVTWDHSRKRSRVWSRQSSAPMMIKRKSSKFWPTHLLGGANNVHAGSKAAEEVSTAILIHQNLESEDTDRETLHLLISLLMHFMANLAKPVAADDRPKLKVQNIVIQHLSILLGYLPVEKTFVVPPLKIRFSPMFNAFLSSLPDVLDRNVKVGNLLAPNLLAILIYCPSPQKAPGERYPPNYSLWLVDPPLRHSWLVSSLIFLYKYHYNVEHLSTQVQVLIRLVLNTIQSQSHKCRSLPAAALIQQSQLSMNPSPSAESLGGLEFGPHTYQKDGQTPPITPKPPPGILAAKTSHALHQHLGHTNQHASTAQGDIETGSVAAIQQHHNRSAISRAHGHPVGQSHGQHSSVKHFVSASMPTEAAVQDYGCAEPELAVIPESPKSDDDDDEEDSTSQQTSELLDLVVPLKEQDAVASIHSDDPGVAEAKLLVSQVKTCRPPCTARVSFEEPASGPATKTPSALPSPYGHYGRVFDPHPRLHWKISDNAEQARAEVLERLACTHELPEVTRVKVMEPPVVISSTSSETSEVLQYPAQERLLPIGSPKVASRLLHFDTTGIDSSSRDEDSSVHGGSYEASMSEDTPQLSEDVFPPEIPAPERLLPVGLSSRAAIVQKPLIMEASDAVVVQQNSPNSTGSSSGKKNFGRQMSLGKWEGKTMPEMDALDEKPHSVMETIENKKSESKPKPEEEKIPEEEDEDDDVSGAVTLGGYLPIRRAAPKIIDCGGVVARCSKCGLPLEHFSDEDLALAVLVLTTFIRREPALAAPNLPEIIVTIASLASNPQYPWQVEGNTHIPGSALSVARQALRCIFAQMAPNNVFPQLFQSFTSEAQRPKFFKTVSQVLGDYADMNPASPLQFMLEQYGGKRPLPMNSLNTVLANMAVYLEVVPSEALAISGSNLVQAMEVFFRKLVLIMSSITHFRALLSIIASVLKLPAVASYKGLLEPFGKVVGYCLITGAISFPMLTQICHWCNRAFSRERDKLYMTRLAVVELCSVLRFKSTAPERSVLMMTQLVLSDCGAGYLPLGDEHLAANIISPLGVDRECSCRTCWVEDCKEDPLNPVSTCAADCMRAHLSEIIDYIADAHTISKVKSAFEAHHSPNKDKLGGVLKGGLAQFLAQEMYRNGAGVPSRENKVIVRFLPWLTNPPPLVQQGPREFVESVAHIRLLSWLLLGALHHLGGAPSSGFVGAVHGGASCQPLSFDASNHIADHIQGILAGFPEQSKASVIHMSALFHVFILCQLWTVYVEQLVRAMSGPGSSGDAESRSLLTDFWAKVTPAILSLVSHSKVEVEEQVLFGVIFGYALWQTHCVCSLLNV